MELKGTEEIVKQYLEIRVLKGIKAFFEHILQKKGIGL